MSTIRINNDSQFEFTKNIYKSIRSRKQVADTLLFSKKKNDVKTIIEVPYIIKCPAGYDIEIQLSNITYSFIFSFHIRVTQNFRCDLVIEEDNYEKNPYMKFIPLNADIFAFNRGGEDMLMIFNAFMRSYYKRKNYLNIPEQYYRLHDTCKYTFGRANYRFWKDDNSCTTDFCCKKIQDLRKCKNIAVIVKLLYDTINDIMFVIKIGNF